VTEKKIENMSDNKFDVSTTIDLEKIIIENEIHYDVIIRGEQIKELDKVQKINGSIGLVNSIIENFGPLKGVTGDMYISSWKIDSKIISLNNHQKTNPINGKPIKRIPNKSDKLCFLVVFALDSSEDEAV